MILQGYIHLLPRLLLVMNAGLTESRGGDAKTAMLLSRERERPLERHLSHGL